MITAYNINKHTIHNTKSHPSSGWTGVCTHVCVYSCMRLSLAGGRRGERRGKHRRHDISHSPHFFSKHHPHWQSPSCPILITYIYNTNTDNRTHIYTVCTYIHIPRPPKHHNHQPHAPPPPPPSPSPTYCIYMYMHMVYMYIYIHVYIYIYIYIHYPRERTPRGCTGRGTVTHYLGNQWQSGWYCVHRNKEKQRSPNTGARANNSLHK